MNLGFFSRIKVKPKFPWGKKTAPEIPSFSDTPFGRRSSGLFWEADDSRRKHRRLSVRWAASHYIVGLLGAGLAATAGVTSLTEVFSKTQAAWIAIASAITSSVGVFLRSDDKRQFQSSLKAAWDNLQQAIIYVYDTRPIPTDPENEPDPAGWQDILDPLEARANSLRASKLPAEMPAPRWGAS